MDFLCGVGKNARIFFILYFKDKYLERKAGEKKLLRCEGGKGNWRMVGLLRGMIG